MTEEKLSYGEALFRKKQGEFKRTNMIDCMVVFQPLRYSKLTTTTTKKQQRKLKHLSPSTWKKYIHTCRI